MQKQEFITSINAPREKVWNVLWGETTYPQWTKAFSENSQVTTDWQKGSRAFFHDGTGNGMVSRIEENIPNQFMSIQHLGEVKDGVEDTTSEKVQQWAGAFENYTLKDKDGGTELVVHMDINDEFAEMFAGMWPKALARVKELAEE